MNNMQELNFDPKYFDKNIRNDKPFNRVNLPIPPDDGEAWKANTNITKEEIKTESDKYQSICSEQTKEELALFEKYKADEVDNKVRSIPLNLKPQPLPPDDGDQYDFGKEQD